jgi:N-methylhydantoinase B
MWLNEKPVDHGVYRRLAPGDRVRFVLSGGGGYGDPREREPERVLADVEQGYVSVEQAEADYAVVISADRMEVDVEATASLRGRPS